MHYILITKYMHNYTQTIIHIYTRKHIHNLAYRVTPISAKQTQIYMHVNTLHNHIYNIKKTHIEKA